MEQYIKKQKEINFYPDPKYVESVQYGLLYNNANKRDEIVSCICPTYNRRKFLPYLVYIYDYQTYPNEKRELLILDDSDNSNIDLFDLSKEYKRREDDVLSQEEIDKTREIIKNNNIRYYFYDQRIILGKKRNLINDFAKKYAEYIVCFDDDDFYFPQRIKKTIQAMKQQRTQLAGCSLLYMYFTSLNQENKIYSIGPYGKLHCTNGTMAYHVDYLQKGRYDDLADKAEEKQFLNSFREPIAQLNPLDIMICIAHSSNTFNKQKLLGMQYLSETAFQLKKIVKDKYLLNFYNVLTENDIKNQDLQQKNLEENQMKNHSLQDIESGYHIVDKQHIINLYNQYKNNPIYENLVQQINRIYEKYREPDVPDLLYVYQGQKIMQHQYFFSLLRKQQQLSLTNKHNPVMLDILLQIQQQYLQKKLKFI